MNLYRKYRPNTWDRMVEQEEIVVPLKRQVVEGKPKHAYLLVGTRGTGKTSTAKIFAKGINCLNPVDGSPCGQCTACTTQSLDIMELDAASNNGVDDARKIRENTLYSPQQRKYKVYIIDEVHMFTREAFNALLLTLEEPPEYCIFFLCTTELNKVPVTIRSRCEINNFKRISNEGILGYMKYVLLSENRHFEDDALSLIASNSDGAMRDALSMLDQACSSTDGVITEDIVSRMIGCTNIQTLLHFSKAILNCDINGCLSLLDVLVMEGKDMVILINEVTKVLRDILMVKISPSISLDSTKEYKLTITGLAENCMAENILSLIKYLNDVGSKVRFGINPVITLKTELISYYVSLQSGNSVVELSARLNTVEDRLSSIINTGKVITREVLLDVIKVDSESNIDFSCHSLSNSGFTDYQGCENGMSDNTHDDSTELSVSSTIYKVDTEIPAAVEHTNFSDGVVDLSGPQPVLDLMCNPVSDLSDEDKSSPVYKFILDLQEKDSIFDTILKKSLVQVNHGKAITIYSIIPFEHVIDKLYTHVFRNSEFTLTVTNIDFYMNKDEVPF